MCIEDGVLRAKVDGELEKAESLAVERHLAGCARCRARAEEIAARAGRVQALFAGLAPGSGDVPAGADAAYARFAAARRRSADEERTRWWTPRLTPAWAAVAGAALIAVMVSTGPTRALAQRILGLLRVRSVTVIPMNTNLFSEGRGKLLSQVLADSTTVTKNEQPRPVATKEEATKWAGFTVRLPALRQDAPRLTVEGEHAFNLTVKMERVQAMLNIAGRPDLQVPPGLAGAKVSVDVPRGVKATWGECPQRPPDAAAARGIDWNSCLVLVQAPVPTVVTVPELDLNAIAELGLQISGMTQEEAAAYARTVDWTSTLAIPLPRGETDYQTVRVNGVDGVVITIKARDTVPAGYALIWIKDGVVYSVGGFGNPAMAVPLAESLG